MGQEARKWISGEPRKTSHGNRSFCERGVATLLRNEHQSTAFPRPTDIGIVKTVKSGYGVNPLAVSRRINDLEELNEMKIRARCPVFTNTEFVVEIMKARGNAGVREPSNRLDHVRSESPSFFTVKCSEYVLTLLWRGKFR